MTMVSHGIERELALRFLFRRDALRFITHCFRIFLRSIKGCDKVFDKVGATVRCEKHCWILFRSLRLAVPVRLTILGSGSAGNCAYVETEETRVLIDAGFSLRQTRQRLAGIGRAPENLT